MAERSNLGFGSLSDNAISFLFEDSQKGLWIGTNKNLSEGGGRGN
ncbi:MAG: hypothetical protein KDD01_08170 [Phaeodactylibacter sp.]|nr:hypothetical protein [Phaeodactylibacter sp.]